MPIRTDPQPDANRRQRDADAYAHTDLDALTDAERNVDALTDAERSVDALTDADVDVDAESHGDTHSHHGQYRNRHGD